MIEKVEPFDAVDLISKKRHAKELDTEEIQWLVDAFTREKVAPEQMSAWLMAVVIQGMSRREVVDLTRAMIASGETMKFTDLEWPAIDKHSTGGVGDKITLPLVPLVASYGVAVPQLSGRGLGHTGGTLDKLESFTGWQANITNAQMREALSTIGGVICAAGSGLAPADKRMYALRDVTGTVAAVPLIASSIMSKKIAEGAGGLVLDVKFGRGAFMQDPEDARQLAQTMVDLGHDAGLKTVALLTDMNTPLGRSIGNANEVLESIDVLSGGGPEDVRELTITLANEMLSLAGKDGIDVSQNLDNGKALDVWRQMIASQGADPDEKLFVARETETVRAERDGYVQSVDALDVGIAAWRLGAGRAEPGAPVDHSAGIEVLVKPGASVRQGDPLFTLHCSSEAKVARALEKLHTSVVIGDDKPAATPLVRARITESSEV